MQARLIRVSGESLPEVIDLDPSQIVTIGRSKDNTIVIPRDEHASRLHARVFFQEGQWKVEDLGLNGTKVHRERIHKEVIEIEHDQEIRIGDVRFRFLLVDPVTSSNSALTRLPPSGPGSTRIHPPSTELQIDELSMLHQFMSPGLDTSDVNDLVRRGLEIVLHQTGACLVGYLSLDPTDPLTKMVIPELAQVDATLSRHLTRHIEREKRTIWLGGDVSHTKQDSDSLNQFHDAICVPLRAMGRDLGALHVYIQNRHFTDRHVRFCEALAGYLSQGLHIAKDKRTREAEVRRLRGHGLVLDVLLGDSKPMIQLREKIRRLALQMSTVLIQGESGSGKELVASALHRDSPRSSGPFVVVNCGAIANAMVEAELFGYRKGAFTGAIQDHPGYFQQADEGTLFLDEIGELPLEFQAKLLRVLENKRIRPIGPTAEIQVDVRIVAATNRNLDAEVRAGRFRQDLHYRINPIRVDVPPLRDHLDDIPILVNAFLSRFSEECHRDLKITNDAIRELQRYPWPGNVRQLRGLLESLAVMSESDAIDVEAVRRYLTPEDAVRDGPATLKLEEIERWAINKALKQTNQNISQAAQILEISRDTMYAKMKKFGIQREVG